MRLLRKSVLDAAQQFLPDASEQLIERAFCAAQLSRETLHRGPWRISSQRQLTAFTRQLRDAGIQSVELAVPHGHLIRAFFG